MHILYLSLLTNKHLIIHKQFKTNNLKQTKMKISKSLAAKLDRVQTAQTNKDQLSNFERLLATSAHVQVENLTLSKAIANFELSAKVFLTEKQLALVTAKLLIAEIKATEALIGKQYFTSHEIALIANKILKRNDANIARALRVAKQNKKAAAK